MSISSSSSLPPLVLVTGVSGYIGTWVAYTALKLGYRVRGTVRSISNENKISHLRNLCPGSNYLIEQEEQDQDQEQLNQEDDESEEIEIKFELLPENLSQTQNISMNLDEDDNNNEKNNNNENNENKQTSNDMFDLNNSDTHHGFNDDLVCSDESYEQSLNISNLPSKGYRGNTLQQTVLSSPYISTTLPRINDLHDKNDVSFLSEDSDRGFQMSPNVIQNSQLGTIIIDEPPRPSYSSPASRNGPKFSPSVKIRQPSQPPTSLHMSSQHSNQHPSVSISISTNTPHQTEDSLHLSSPVHSQNTFGFDFQGHQNGNGNGSAESGSEHDDDSSSGSDDNSSNSESGSDDDENDEEEDDNEEEDNEEDEEDNESQSQNQSQNNSYISVENPNEMNISQFSETQNLTEFPPLKPLSLPTLPPIVQKEPYKHPQSYVSQMAFLDMFDILFHLFNIFLWLAILSSIGILIGIIYVRWVLLTSDNEAVVVLGIRVTPAMLAIR